jgi:hypothetical protein
MGTEHSVLYVEVGEMRFNAIAGCGLKGSIHGLINYKDTKP